MSFSHHGHYTLEKEQGYFIVTYIGSWNEEAAKAFLEVFNPYIVDSGFEKFGIISDLSDWEGATPEALQLGKEAIDDFYAKGQMVSAHVTGSIMKQHFMQEMQKLQAARMAFNQLDTLESAKKWMETKIKELF